MNSLIKVSALVGLGVAAFVAIKNWTAKMVAVRKVVHSGVLEKIEYTTKHGSTPMVSPGGGLSSAQVVMDMTIVHMQDGTQILVDGKIDILFPKGTPVRVEEDGFGRRSLVADPPLAQQPLDGEVVL